MALSLFIPFPVAMSTTTHPSIHSIIEPHYLISLFPFPNGWISEIGRKEENGITNGKMSRKDLSSVLSIVLLDEDSPLECYYNRICLVRYSSHSWYDKSFSRWENVSVSISIHRTFSNEQSQVSLYTPSLPLVCPVAKLQLVVFRTLFRYFCGVFHILLWIDA